MGSLKLNWLNDVSRYEGNHYTVDIHCTIVQANYKMRNIKHRNHIDIIYQTKLTFLEVKLV